jgi:hypothetical protein
MGAPFNPLHWLIMWEKPLEIIQNIKIMIVETL